VKGLPGRTVDDKERNDGPASNCPADILDLLGRLLKETLDNEPVLLVPRRFGLNTDTEERATTLLDQYKSRHIIFIDQETPYPIRELPNVSYVGPDNWLIGSLAALALAAYPGSAGKEAFRVLTVEGPAAA
jgi:hypothetical protein